MNESTTVLSEYPNSEYEENGTLVTSTFMPRAGVYNGIYGAIGVSATYLGASGTVLDINTVILDFAEMDRLIELYQQYRKEHEKGAVE